MKAAKSIPIGFPAKGASRLGRSLAGAIDLMLLVECGSNGDLDGIRRQIATIPGVATAQTHVALRTHFDRRGG